MNPRWLTARPFLVVASVGIVAGGLVAAVTGPLEWRLGSWLAAYLVLVVGVAQVGFGVGRALLPADVDETSGTVVAELASWNLGNLLVMGGTLTDSPLVVAFGSALLLVALVLWLRAVRRTDSHRGWVWAYRGLAVFLAASVAVGTVLSVIRAR